MACASKTFTCPTCSISVKTLKAYVDHQSLHKNEANGQYLCCIVGCKSRFIKYSAFKSHMYRTHRQSCSMSHNETVQGPFQCEKPNCQKLCVDLKDLLTHLKSHLSNREDVHCPFKACGKIYSLKASFTTHIHRKHKHATDVHVSVALRHSVPSQSSDVIESQSDGDQVDEPEEILAPADMKGLYMRNLCLFYMKLQAKYLIPASTIQMIAEEINSLNLVCQQHTKNQLKVALQANTHLSESEIECALNSLDDTDLHTPCSSPLSTDYKRRQIFSEELFLCASSNYYFRH